MQPRKKRTFGEAFNNPPQNTLVFLNFSEDLFKEDQRQKPQKLSPIQFTAIQLTPIQKNLLEQMIEIIRTNSHKEKNFTIKTRFDKYCKKHTFYKFENHSFGSYEDFILLCQNYYQLTFKRVQGYTVIHTKTNIELYDPKTDEILYKILENKNHQHFAKQYDNRYKLFHHVKLPETPQYDDWQNFPSIYYVVNTNCNRSYIRYDLTNLHEANMYNQLGISLSKQNKINDSIKVFQQALNYAPNNSNIYYNMGKSLSNKQEFDQAFQHYKLALTYDPDSSPAFAVCRHHYLERANVYYNLVNVKIKQKLDREASLLLENVIDLYSDADSLHPNLISLDEKKVVLEKQDEIIRLSLELESSPTLISFKSI